MKEDIVPMKFVPCFLVVVAALLASGGCGSSAGQPELGTVSGVVNMDGQPLAGVTVSFAPAKGRTSSAMTDAQGKYELVYVHNTKGACVGQHTVHIASQGGLDGGGNPNEESGGKGAPRPQYFKGKIPAEYNEKSTLTATVKAGANTFNFDLKSKP